MHRCVVYSSLMFNFFCFCIFTFLTDMSHAFSTGLRGSKCFSLGMSPSTCEVFLIFLFELLIVFAKMTICLYFRTLSPEGISNNYQKCKLVGIFWLCIRWFNISSAWKYCLWLFLLLIFLGWGWESLKTRGLRRANDLQHKNMLWKCQVLILVRPIDCMVVWLFTDIFFFQESY